jgi:hypothetical protein
MDINGISSVISLGKWFEAKSSGAVFYLKWILSFSIPKGFFGSGAPKGF